MAETPRQIRFGNLGVPVGVLLVDFSFFLPWLGLSGLSGFDIASRPDYARGTMILLGLRDPLSGDFGRYVFLVPILVLSVLWLDLAAPVGSRHRTAARIVMLILAAIPAAFFMGVGLFFGAKLAAGFWGSLMGSLFMLVGGVFNVARNE